MLSFMVDKSTVDYREPFTARAAVVGSGPLTYDWTIDGGSPSFVRTASPILTTSFSTPSSQPRIQLTVRNSRGEAVGAPLAMTVRPDAPVITSQPTHVSTPLGREISLRFERNPTAGDVEVEWRHDGVLVSPRRDPTLAIRCVTLPPATTGTYTVTCATRWARPSHPRRSCSRSIRRRASPT